MFGFMVNLANFVLKMLKRGISLLIRYAIDFFFSQSVKILQIIINPMHTINLSLKSRQIIWKRFAFGKIRTYRKTKLQLLTIKSYEKDVLKVGKSCITIHILISF